MAITGLLAGADENTGKTRNYKTQDKINTATITFSRSLILSSSLTWVKV